MTNSPTWVTALRFAKQSFHRFDQGNADFSEDSGYDGNIGQEKFADEKIWRNPSFPGFEIQVKVTGMEIAQEVRNFLGPSAQAPVALVGQS